jgi:hypothetical protein
MCRRESAWVCRVTSFPAVATAIALGPFPLVPAALGLASLAFCACVLCLAVLVVAALTETAGDDRFPVFRLVAFMETFRRCR